ncbi:Uncharacterised protein [Raoultella terrigena]|uniref:Uncharacterized protein n=1 Tax=Raoultella terrigena TaxID=577 RepID=A0A4U9D3E2_RAOTE|nr:Uncharacterised protein [Raoultella terrigena]
MLRAFPLAKKGEGLARLPHFMPVSVSWREAPTHENIIDNNRALNWPV